MVDNKFKVEELNNPQTQQPRDNPNLISRKSMQAFTRTASNSSRATYHEILTRLNNAKNKPKKLQILRDYDSEPLRMLMKAAFDPNIKWDMPTGTPPYKANEAPIGTQHTWLADESKKLWHFLVGGNPGLSKTRKETMYIQVLENLSKEEAILLNNIKDKKLNKVYKGLTANLVKEAFNWNDEFMRRENA
tara:strand:+ start:2018 stop:2587 length:570 start_codon:yes stop_codon:yes gene_type:complete